MFRKKPNKRLEEFNQKINKFSKNKFEINQTELDDFHKELTEYLNICNKNEKKECTNILKRLEELRSFDKNDPKQFKKEMEIQIGKIQQKISQDHSFLGWECFLNELNFLKHIVEGSNIDHRILETALKKIRELDGKIKRKSTQKNKVKEKALIIDLEFAIQKIKNDFDNKKDHGEIKKFLENCFVEVEKIKQEVRKKQILRELEDLEGRLNKLIPEKKENVDVDGNLPSKLIQKVPPKNFSNKDIEDLIKFLEINKKFERSFMENLKKLKEILIKILPDQEIVEKIDKIQERIQNFDPADYKDIKEDIKDVRNSIGANKSIEFKQKAYNHRLTNLNGILIDKKIPSLMDELFQIRVEYNYFKTKLKERKLLGSNQKGLGDLLNRLNSMENLPDEMFEEQWKDLIGEINKSLDFLKSFEEDKIETYEKDLNKILIELKKPKSDLNQIYEKTFKLQEKLDAYKGNKERKTKLNQKLEEILRQLENGSSIKSKNLESQNSNQNKNLIRQDAFSETMQNTKPIIIASIPKNDLQIFENELNQITSEINQEGVNLTKVYNQTCILKNKMDAHKTHELNQTRKFELLQKIEEIIDYINKNKNQKILLDNIEILDNLIKNFNGTQEASENIQRTFLNLIDNTSQKVKNLQETFKIKSEIYRMKKECVEIEELIFKTDNLNEIERYLHSLLTQTNKFKIDQTTEKIKKELLDHLMKLNQKIKICKLDQIENKIEPLKLLLNKFKGTKLEEEYYIIEEIIQNAFLEVDAIQSQNDQVIKEKRLKLVRKLEKYDEEYNLKKENAPKTLTQNEIMEKLSQIKDLEKLLEIAHQTILQENLNFVQIDEDLNDLFKRAILIEDKKEETVCAQKAQLITKIQNEMLLLSQYKNFYGIFQDIQKVLTNYSGKEIENDFITGKILKVKKEIDLNGAPDAILGKLENLIKIHNNEMNAIQTLQETHRTLEILRQGNTPDIQYQNLLKTVKSIKTQSRNVQKIQEQYISRLTGILRPPPSRNSSLRPMSMDQAARINQNYESDMKHLNKINMDLVKVKESYKAVENKMLYYDYYWNELAKLRRELEGIIVFTKEGHQVKQQIFMEIQQTYKYFYQLANNVGSTPV